jgi:hypothetical protein
MPEVPVSLEMKRLLHEIWQEFSEHQPTCPKCGAPWAEYGWDHESAYGERISAACENFHEFVIDFDDDFIIQEATDRQGEDDADDTNGVIFVSATNDYVAFVEVIEDDD